MVIYFLGQIVSGQGFQMLAALIGSMPVSYTHLDVYKRQGQESVRKLVKYPELCDADGCAGAKSCSDFFERVIVQRL